MGQEYELKKIERAIDDHEWMLENDYGYNHYFSSAMLFEYFTPVKSKKQVTISVAHQIVALDVELGCMQAEMDNLKERMAERRATLESLLDEYGVGGYLMFDKYRLQLVVLTAICAAYNFANGNFILGTLCAVGAAGNYYYLCKAGE